MSRTILRALALMLALALALPAMAELSANDIKAFTKASQKVEEAVAKASASDATLSEMRAEMVKWRTTFTAEQDANADQIATVKSQIAALGPAPEDGATEDALIAKRRTELTEQLSKLQAPGITATEAASRADSIIRTIDKLVRERQADKLLRLSPSVANPVNWPAAASLMRWMGAWIYDETRWRFTQPVNYDELRTNAPLIIGLVLAALVLLARGRRWMMHATDWLLGKTAMRGRNLISGLVSLGQVVVPVLGANLLVIAVEQTSLFGPILTELFRDAPVFLFTVLMAWWLGSRIFPARPGVESALSLGEEGRAEGRIHAVSLGLAFAAHQLLLLWIAPHAEDFLGGASDLAADQAQAVAERADAALSVLQAPLQIFAAVGLFRMGQLLRRKITSNIDGEDGAFRRQLLRWLGTALLLIALAGPVLGVIGYVSAADALVWPAVASLGLFAAVATVQSFLAELYVTLARGQEARRDALLPVLGGFLIALASLPILALIWGARIEDLLELWTSFQNGIAVGGVRISPTSFITFAVVFGIGYALTRLLQGALKSTILPKTTLDKGGQNAITSGIGYVGLASAALVAISTAGIDLSSLAIVAGALSVGIGFGLQTIVQNFVSGIILLIERPISEGDWIEVGGYQGIVKNISVRSTVVETFDRTDVIVPNADLISGSVTNWTRGNKTGRLVVPVGVAYGSDTRKVEKILTEIAQAHPLVMMTPAPFALFMGFGADSMDFEIRAILSDVNFKLRVLSEMNHQIAERFAAEGVEIPFAQRDIWIRNPETLLSGAGEGAANAAPRADPPPASGLVAARPEPGEGIARLSDNDGREDGDEGDDGEGGGEAR
ncbi:DUF3772 domain-containing protein [Rhodobacter maris]|uniref:Small-conductance mechanosensitive channel n=1 Tax=Rhodobacter maris TaxID=446682 RepID=A0A285TDV8_9RHOB|nr:DUF3772 domain-containing protein [Rhodobacter maris]SOC19915.1 small-conductance mechanosensitive channel [Rhodobacter maris]